MESSRTAYVVVSPFPFQGHINPVMLLAHALHGKGFAITVLHSSARALDPADYRFVPVPVPVPMEVDSKLMESGDIADIVTALNASCEKPFRNRLKALLAAAKDGEGEHVRCVLIDFGWYIFVDGSIYSVSYRVKPLTRH